MSMKKVALLSAMSVALLSSAAAYAGGPDVYAAPPPACPVCVAPFTPFIYIGASAGWAYSDWNNFIDSGAPSDADTNGFTFGGKAGYQFLDNFGIEAGIYDLPNADQTLTLSVPGAIEPVSVTGTVKSWFAYGAATIRAEFPGNPFFHIIGKVGGVYRALDHNGALYDDFNVGDGSYGTVLFGGSLEYDLGAFNLPVAFGVDYLYIPGSNDSFFTSSSSVINVDAAPAAQVVVGTVSLRFAV